MDATQIKFLGIGILILLSVLFTGCMQSKTPLTQSIYEGNLQKTQQYLANGENPNQLDGYGSTPLIEAAKNNNYTLVKLLLEKQAQPDLCNSNQGNCPLVIAAGYTNVQSSEHNQSNIKIIEALIEAGANINIREADDLETPLFVAAREGKTEVAKMLISKGATINEPSMEGSTPLIEAAKNGHLETVKLLAKNGADINKLSPGGLLPLPQSARSQSLKLVQYLIEELGVDVNQQEKDGCSLLSYAVGTGNIQIVDYAISAGAKVDHYHSYKKTSSINSSKWTPLTYAIDDSNIEVVKSLLAAGANPNMEMQAEYEGALYPISPLAIVLTIVSDYETSVLIGNYLLAAGANINAKYNTVEWTVLHEAVYEDSYPMVEYLLENGANPNIQDNTGDTPLDIALDYGYENSISYLQSYGAQTNNYQEKSDDSFGQIFATIAIAGLAGQANLSADQTTQVMSAAVNDIWVKEGKGTQLGSLYSDTIENDPENTSNPVVRELVEKRQQHRNNMLAYQQSIQTEKTPLESSTSNNILIEEKGSSKEKNKVCDVENERKSITTVRTSAIIKPDEFMLGYANHPAYLKAKYEAARKSAQACNGFKAQIEPGIKCDLSGSTLTCYSTNTEIACSCYKFEDQQYKKSISAGKSTTR